MPAELEVDPGRLGFLQMVWLVVQQQGEEAVGRGQLRQGSPAAGGAVVPPDDADAAGPDGGVPEQPDSGVGVERLRPRAPCDVFVVAGAAVDGGADPAEDFGVVPFAYGPQGPVQEVPGEKDQVGLFGVDPVHPAAELPGPDVIAGVEVAGQHDRERPLQWFVGLQVICPAGYVAALQASADQQHGEDTEHRTGAGQGILQESSRY